MVLLICLLCVSTQSFFQDSLSKGIKFFHCYLLLKRAYVSSMLLTCDILWSMEMETREKGSKRNIDFSFFGSYLFPTLKHFRVSFLTLIFCSPLLSMFLVEFRILVFPRIPYHILFVWVRDIMNYIPDFRDPLDKKCNYTVTANILYYVKQ